MTRKTFNIIMTHCQEEWKNRRIDDLKSKSAHEMAEILFHYPLNRLLDRIISQNIDGSRFIESVIAPNEDIIAEETGWHDDDVYQIQSILFRHHSCTQSQFEQNMNDVLSNEPATKLSKDIADRIKGVMSQHNIEETHYKIKNALNIDEFADSVMNMVDEWTQNEHKENPKTKDKSELVITQIYRAIAQCFVFDAKGKYHTKRDDLVQALQHWICNHCGNCNVNSYVNKGEIFKLRTGGVHEKK
eukprot:32315_1